jgi:DNA-binding response OmpR family regulator
MTNVPVIFLTAKDSAEDKIQGLSLGADDYIVKPFNFAELKYRLMSCLRRAENQKEKKTEIIFPTDSVMLDCDRHELVVKNRTIYLTPKEFEVLRLLVRYAGKVITTDAILLNVWGSERIGEPDLVKQYIYRLRQKIEKDKSAPAYIHTIWGSGYYFDVENKAQFSLS